MVGIVIEHDLIAVPQPIVGVSVVGIRDTEKESAEPKSPGAAATESIDMAPADAARESSMFERPVEVYAGSLRPESCPTHWSLAWTCGASGCPD